MRILGVISRDQEKGWPPSYKMRFSFQAMLQDIQQYGLSKFNCWRSKVFHSQVLFKSGSSHRNGSSREEGDVEEELKRIDDLHAKDQCNEEREKMRKNILGI